MNETLKPCPFCGGKGVVFDQEQNDCNYSDFTVECSACNAITAQYLYKNKAIEAWNKRADDKYNELVEFLQNIITISCDANNNENHLVCCKALKLLRKHGVEV